VEAIRNLEACQEWATRYYFATDEGVFVNDTANSATDTATSGP
jgi:hypothetical protein